MKWGIAEFVLGWLVISAALPLIPQIIIGLKHGPQDIDIATGLMLAIVTIAALVLGVQLLSAGAVRVMT